MSGDWHAQLCPSLFSYVSFTHRGGGAFLIIQVCCEGDYVDIKEEDSEAKPSAGARISSSPLNSTGFLVDI